MGINRKDILFKRSIDFNDGKIVRLDNIYAKNVATGEVKTIDPLLDNVFKKRQGEAKARSILTTIQQCQLDIVNASFDDDVFVQGVAGSGKTMVLFERLTRYVYQKSNEDKKVYFVSPNRGFDSYFSDYFRNAKLEEKVTRLLMSELLCEFISFYKQDYAKKKHMYEKKNGVVSLAVFSDADREKYLESMVRKCVTDKDVEEGTTSFIYSHTLTSVIKNTWREFQPEYLTVNGGVVYSFDGFGKSLKLFFKNLRDALRSHKCDTSIVPQSENGLVDDALDTAIPTCLAYAIVRFLFEKEEDLAHSELPKIVFVDECQDYYYRLIGLIKRVSPDTKLNLFGDIWQDIAKHGGTWDKKSGIADQLKSHNDNLSFKKFSLDTNYRSSEEIVAYCNEKFPSKVKDVSCSYSTMKPTIIEPNRLIALLSLHETMGDRSAIIYQEDYRKAVKGYLEKIIDHYGFEHVRLYEPIDAKGLEFDNVFVIGASRMKDPVKYVSFTRALNELYLVQGKE